jgi:hypothetical protein
VPRRGKQDLVAKTNLTRDLTDASRLQKEKEKESREKEKGKIK